jgi:legumain
MMYDDVADSRQNPFKGKLFNKPTAPGVPGDDVYAGIVIDYKSDAVTPDVFAQVLTGNTTGLSAKGSGRVLQSTESDNVFVNFVDHGGVGLIAFPSSVMHATQLVDTLKSMHEKQMYKNLVFYLEACESGSMFVNLPTDINIYATTAANGKESSWGTYCSGNESQVDGKSINSCLGDLYSVNWMENVDANPSMVESLLQQYNKVKSETAPADHPTPGRPGGSHVMQFGDLSMDSLAIGKVMGDKSTGLARSSAARAPDKLASAVDSREAEIHSMRQRQATATTDDERAAAAQDLAHELELRSQVEKTFRTLVARAYPKDEAKQSAALTDQEALPLRPSCELAIHRAVSTCTAVGTSGYLLQFQRAVVNLCADTSLGWSDDTSKAIAAAEDACRDAKSDQQRVATAAVLV